MDDRSGQIVAGQYEIVRAIGQGGMAVVYLATQLATARQVAIKIIQRDLAGIPQVVLRFQNEADVIARLSHPNTIRVLDSGQTETGELFIVTELLSGCSLSEEIERGPMAIDRLIRVAQQLCFALAEAHEAGIFHRDVKPDNIFVDETSGEMSVKLIDFGLAKLKDSVPLTAPNILIGSMLYVSPEQAGQAEVDHRTDLYSLGVTMFEMATGRCPFTATKVIEILHDHLFTPPPDLRRLRPDIPLELANLIDQMLQKDPAMRPSSAAAVRAELEQIQVTRPLGSSVPRFDTLPTTTISLKTRLIDIEPPKSNGIRTIAIYAGLGTALLGVALLGSIMMEAPQKTANPIVVEVERPIEKPPAVERAPAKEPEPPQKREKLAAKPERQRSVVKEAARAPKKPNRAPKKASPEPVRADPPVEKPKQPEKPKPLPVTF